MAQARAEGPSQERFDHLPVETENGPAAHPDYRAPQQVGHLDHKSDKFGVRRWALDVEAHLPCAGGPPGEGFRRRGVSQQLLQLGLGEGLLKKVTLSDGYALLRKELLRLRAGASAASDENLGPHQRVAAGVATE